MAEEKIPHFNLTGNLRLEEDLPGKERLPKVWDIRWRLVEALVGAGVSVVQSDADVVWFAPPSLDLSPSFHVLAGTGSHPIAIWKKYGFSLFPSCFLFSLQQEQHVKASPSAMDSSFCEEIPKSAVFSKNS